MDNNTFYFNSYIIRNKRKILRLIELVCCITCFALAVTVFLIRLHLTTKVILMVVSTTFLFVTLVDATSWLQSRPIGHRTWIVFSVTAFHMFSLCGGFLVFLRRVTNQTLLLATCVVNFVTAYVYILDCLLIVLQYIKWIHRNNTRVLPSTVQVDRAVSTCMVHQEWEYVPRGTPRLRSTLRSRPYVVPTCSYGGTFAVSKDFPPLPTPDPLRKFSPRRRMYCTLVNPSPIQEGSGDFSRSCKTTPSNSQTNPFSITKGKICRSVSTNYRVEIHDHRRFYSKIWSQSLLRKFQYSKISAGSQSYGEESAAVLQAELNPKIIEGTNVAEEGDPGGKNQASKDMIVAYCKPESGNPPISMQDCVFHHYYQQPCLKCGRTHYQQQTTINGTLCCPPVVRTAGKNENTSPVQIIQTPCGNHNCPGTQGATMQSPCWNPNCTSVQEKKNQIGTSTSSIKRNGLQSEYSLMRRRDGYQEVECPPCGRRYNSQVYTEEPAAYCVKECPRPSMYADSHQVRSCSCGTEPSIGAGQQKNCEVMAVQEMIDKTVQIRHDTSEYNPQTSETRIMNASYIKELLEGKCDKKCTGTKSREGSSKAEEETSEMTTESDELAREGYEEVRESKVSKSSKISRTSKASKIPSRTKQIRLSAGGPLQQSAMSTDGSRKDIAAPLQTRSFDRQPSSHAPAVSKASSRSVAKQPMQEIEVQRSYATANLEGVPRNQSVCDCMALGKPSKDCKRLRTRKDEYGKNCVSYRDLAQDSSDEPIRETIYDEIELETEQPVEEVPFQKTRLLYQNKAQPSSTASRRVATQSQNDLPQEPVEEPQLIKSKISNRGIPQKSVHEPSIKSKASNREVQSQRPIYEPSIKSKVSNREVQSQRSIHEPSIKSKASNREVQSQRSIYEPSIKSKASNREVQSQRSIHEPSIKSKASNREVQSQRSIHEPATGEVGEQISVHAPSVKSGQDDEIITLPHPLRYTLVSKENVEICEKCCTQKVKPKKRCWNIFKKKKK